MVQEVDRQFIKDAVMTASLEIHSQVADFDGDQIATFDFEEIFLDHHEASVSPVWIDSEGRPTDVWGKHFRVTFDSDSPIKWVECASAGRDKKFGTADDIAHRSNGL